MLDKLITDVLANPQWLTLGTILIFGFKATRAFSRLEMKVDTMWRNYERDRGMTGQHE